MSCYEWEQGTITIPAKEWSAFRKGLLTRWNERQLNLFADAQRAYKAAKAAAKGKRGKGRLDTIRSTIAQACGGKIADWGDFEPTGYGRDDTCHDKWDAITHLILKSTGWGKDRKVTLVAPKKSLLYIHKVSQGCTVNLPYASVTFDNMTRSVTWDVPENNHAKEHARGHWFAQALFTALGRITWTRGSGGTIIGNDEYNRDAGREYAGGGGSYVTAEYSAAASKRARERLRRARW